MQRILTHTHTHTDTHTHTHARTHTHTHTDTEMDKPLAIGKILLISLINRMSMHLPVDKRIRPLNYRQIVYVLDPHL